MNFVRYVDKNVHKLWIELVKEEGLWIEKIMLDGEWQTRRNGRRYMGTVLQARTGQHHMRLRPGEICTVGKNGLLKMSDIPDAPGIPPIFLSLAWVYDSWRITNIGRAISVDIQVSAPEGGGEFASLQEASSCSLPRGNYSVAIHHCYGTYYVEISVGHIYVVKGPTHSGMRFTSSQKKLLVALGERILRKAHNESVEEKFRGENAGRFREYSARCSGLVDGQAYGHRCGEQPFCSHMLYDEDIPPSYIIAEKLGWRMTQFNRKLDNVCQKFARLGVEGMLGNRKQKAMFRRNRAVAYALHTGVITPQDVSLLAAI